VAGAAGAEDMVVAPGAGAAVVVEGLVDLVAA
jgi:hypothetical protein